MPAPTIAASVFRFALVAIGRMLSGVVPLHRNRRSPDPARDAEDPVEEPHHPRIHEQKTLRP